MQGLTAAQAAKHASRLQDTFLFRGIPETEIAHIIKRAGISLVRYAAGDALIKAPGAEQSLQILLRGAATVSKQAGDAQVYMSELAPGAIFGMAALFSCADKAPRRYPTAIVAKETCTTLSILEHTLRALLREDERLLENYLCYLNDRIYFLNARIESLLYPGTKGRVLLYLRQNAENGVLTHSLSAMAQALSISRATLYRALDALEAEGDIHRNGRHIYLSDVVKNAPLE